MVYERYFSVFIFIVIFVVLGFANKIKWEKLSFMAFFGPVVFAVIDFAIQ